MNLLAEVVGVLEREGIAPALIGAAALAIHGIWESRRKASGLGGR